MEWDIDITIIIIIVIIIIIIIIIVVVVVVDDDTDYWVYLSSDHLFQVYYKVRQVLLQSATAFLLQSAMICYYKVRQLFYYKVLQVLLQSATGNEVLQSVTILLQSAIGITKYDSTACKTC